MKQTQLCKCSSSVNHLDRWCGFCSGEIVANPFGNTFELTQVLYTKEQIATKVEQLAAEIDRQYLAVDGVVVLLGALTGAFVFLADLSRAVKRAHRVEMVRASSYHGGTESSGTVHLNGGELESLNLMGTDVLVVEDILDTGLTYQTLRRELLERAKVRSVQFCSLLSKPDKFAVVEGQLNIDTKLIGFQMRPPRFVVGYGLDYRGYFRQLPFIAEAQEKE